MRDTLTEVKELIRVNKKKFKKIVQTILPLPYTRSFYLKIIG